MQIDAQQMEDLLRIQMQTSAQSALKKPSVAAPNTFENILNDAIIDQDINQANAANAPVSHAAGQSHMISQMLLNVDPNQNQFNEANLLQNTFDNASGTLDLWDMYAKKLSESQDSNLREAYSILESIGNNVEQLKSNASNLQTPNFNLNSLINEMDIMATTEKIKFNRGDYAQV